jgi:LysM repeat protein
MEASRTAALTGISAGGMTKDQIEARTYQIGQQTFLLEQQRKIVQNEITVLQDKNYNLKVGELAKAQALLDNEIKLIEQSRLKYAEAELAIKSAEIKTDEYTDALKRSEEVLKRMAILWATLGSKASADLGGITGAVEDPKDKGVDKKAEDKPPAKTNLISVTAKSGQTLSSIAKANNTTVKELLAINPVLTSNPKYNNGNTIFNGTTVKVPGKMYGGVVSGNGMLDKVPTMLTPGEFVMNRAASQKFGPLLERMNESKYPGSMSLGGNPVVNMVSNNSANNRSSSVYNYSLNVGVNGTSASPDDIARTVITQIRHMDARRLRGNTY